MAAVMMLFMLVLVVATTATLVTVVVMRALNANNPRPQLPPPPHGVQSQQLGPGARFAPYPAHRVSAADRERIMILLRGGQKIQAIKLYREITGAGLREAKDAVEHLERYQ